MPLPLPNVKRREDYMPQKKNLSLDYWIDEYGNQMYPHEMETMELILAIKILNAKYNMSWLWGQAKIYKLLKEEQFARKLIVE
jgi:hypothetical protein